MHLYLCSGLWLLGEVPAQGINYFVLPVKLSLHYVYAIETPSTCTYSLASWTRGPVPGPVMYTYTRPAGPRARVRNSEIKVRTAYTSCMRTCRLCKYTEPEHKTSRRRQSKTVSKRMKVDIILLQFSFQALTLLMQVLVAIAATGRSGKISATGINITTY